MKRFAWAIVACIAIVVGLARDNGTPPPPEERTYHIVGTVVALTGHENVRYVRLQFPNDRADERTFVCYLRLETGCRVLELSSWVQFEVAGLKRDGDRVVTVEMHYLHRK